MISPADHGRPGHFFLPFAVLGSMSYTPDIKFIEMISIDDGPAIGRAAEEAAQGIKEGTLSRAAVKRENDGTKKQTSSGPVNKKRPRLLRLGPLRSRLFHLGPPHPVCPLHLRRPHLHLTYILMAAVQHRMQFNERS